METFLFVKSYYGRNQAKRKTHVKDVICVASQDPQRTVAFEMKKNKKSSYLLFFFYGGLAHFRP
jgi:hypothetical protein